MGLMHLICWTNDHFIKKHWNFQENDDFPGCGFSKFSKISIFGLLTIASYTVFLRGFSLWQRGIDSTKQMTVYDQITFFIKFSIFFPDCFEDAKYLGKYSKNRPKTQFFRGFLGRRHQAGGLLLILDLVLARTVILDGIRTWYQDCPILQFISYQFL